MRCVYQKYVYIGLPTFLLILYLTYHNRNQHKVKYKSAPTVFLRDKYWIFKNYVTADTEHVDLESITLATTSDFTFLNNIIFMVVQFEGPISVAISAPGTDFYKALESIAFLRTCEHDLIRKYVTFHLIVESNHVVLQNNTRSLIDAYKNLEANVNCSQAPPYATTKGKDTYRNRKQLKFPINLARNVAIQSSTTHFILSLDIELYPPKNFISKFLAMIEQNPEYLGKKMVYVLPHFEVSGELEIPASKRELRELMRKGQVIWFHEKICSVCHKIPHGKEWLIQPDRDDITIFKSVKRRGPWEPFFVLTRNEPQFDERFTWEGRSDKMPQGFSLCLLDYDYAILNDAFIVHKPGIKQIGTNDKSIYLAMSATNKFKEYVVKPEMRKVFGNIAHCYL